MTIEQRRSLLIVDDTPEYLQDMEDEMRLSYPEINLLCVETRQQALDIIAASADEIIAAVIDIRLIGNQVDGSGEEVAQAAINSSIPNVVFFSASTDDLKGRPIAEDPKVKIVPKNRRYGEWLPGVLGK